MPTPQEFAAECQAMAQTMRRMPKDLRRALASEVKDQVAAPLGRKIAGAATGPYGPALSGAVKVRASADPKIVVGGGRKVVSGGARARQLVFGTEWGGGGRVTRVPRTAKHKGYRVRSTNQFRTAHPFIFPTIGANIPEVLDTFATITLEVIGKELNRA